MADRDDHDQRFKEMLRTFFPDFLRLFFADWAARFDLSAVAWRDKEVLPDPPDGSRHVLDLVAELPATVPTPGADPDSDPKAWLALIHVEVESPDRTTGVKPRLPGYYVHLRAKYRRPVLPIVLYLQVGLDGVGRAEVVEEFWELDVLRLKYLYVGLPGLDAETYVSGDNWLGVALSALMRMPPDRVAELGAEALRRLSEAPLADQPKYLLAECVQAYLPLDAASRAVYDRILEGTEFSGVRAMNKTPRQEGREEGRRVGQAEVIVALWESKFGAAPSGLFDRLVALPPDRLRAIAVAVPAAGSPADLGLDAPPPPAGG